MDRRQALGAALAGLTAWPAAHVHAAVPRESLVKALIARFHADIDHAGVVSVEVPGYGAVTRVADPEVAGEAHLDATSRFALGSISKWLTTVAVLRVVDADMLALDRSISTWLPALARPAGDVPLRSLLSNTSGIPDRVSAAARDDPSLRRSRASALEIAEQVAAGELIFAPGSQFDYSAFNWVLVRAILEAVERKPFAQVLSERVFRPIGARNMGIAESGFEAVQGLAPAWRSLRPPVRKMDALPAFIAASGTFFSTASDLIRAAHAVYGGALLSDGSRDALSRVVVADEGYALGGRVVEIDGARWAWHTGQVGGWRAHLACELGTARSIVVFTVVDQPQRVLADLVATLARS
ncbi:hypothetical protein BH10PSE17_BH10PSE17_21320 [soil metagenome]